MELVAMEEDDLILAQPMACLNLEQYQYCDKVKSETAREVSSGWETCVNWHGHYVLMLLKLLLRENLWLEEVTKAAVAEIWTGQMEMGFCSRLNVHLEIRKDKRVSCLCRWLESTDILERLFKPT